MQILSTALFTIAIAVAFIFALLVFLTGKGDAMSGGSSVRTTFKGKASFDDFISKLTFILGITFMVLMLVLDVLRQRIGEPGQMRLTPDEPAASQPADKPAK